GGSALFLQPGESVRPTHPGPGNALAGELDERLIEAAQEVGRNGRGGGAGGDDSGAPLRVEVAERPDGEWHVISGGSLGGVAVGVGQIAGHQEADGAEWDVEAGDWPRAADQLGEDAGVELVAELLQGGGTVVMAQLVIAGGARVPRLGRRRWGRLALVEQDQTDEVLAGADGVAGALAAGQGGAGRQLARLAVAPVVADGAGGRRGEGAGDAVVVEVLTGLVDLAAVAQGGEVVGGQGQQLGSRHDSSVLTSPNRPTRAPATGSRPPVAGAPGWFFTAPSAPPTPPARPASSPPRAHPAPPSARPPRRRTTPCPAPPRPPPPPPSRR